MKLSTEQKQAIVNYLENPTEAQSRQGLHGIFWTSIMEAVAEVVNRGGDLDALFKKEFDFINFGLLTDRDKETAARALELRKAVGRYPLCQTMLFTEWLDEIFRKVNKGDQKELLERDIKLAEISIRHLNEEIKLQQESRKELLLKNTGENGHTPAPALIKQIDSMEATDILVLESMRVKRAIARGMFLSVEQKRGHVGRETRIQKECAHNDGLIKGIKSKESVLAVKGLEAKLAELFTQTLDAEDAIARKRQTIADIEKRLIMATLDEYLGNKKKAADV